MKKLAKKSELTLQKAIGQALKFTISGKKAILPVLSHVSLVFKPGLIVVRSTDLEAYFEAIVSKPQHFDFHQSGQILISQDLAKQINKAKKIQILDFEHDKSLILDLDGIQINYDAREFSGNYPQFPKVKEDQYIQTIDSKDLKICLGSIATDPAKTILTGIFFNGQEAASTDGYLLTVNKINQIHTKKDLDFNMIIPGLTVNRVSRITNGQMNVYGIDAVFYKNTLPRHLSPMEADHGFKYVCFEDIETGIRITSRLIEGKFPNYNKILPTSFLSKTEVQFADFHEKVKQSESIKRSETHMINFNLGPEPKIFTEHGVIPLQTRQIDHTPEPCRISFNQTYLSEILDYAKISGFERLIIHQNSSVQPVVLKDPEKETLFMIMPIKP